jgi:hypothetical protein
MIDGVDTHSIMTTATLKPGDSQEFRYTIIKYVKDRSIPTRIIGSSRRWACAKQNLGPCKIFYQHTS